MAKISAYGQTAISKWRDPATGTRYVLAARDSYSPGRLLRKNPGDSTYVVVRGITFDRAIEHARARGWQLAHW